MEIIAQNMNREINARNYSNLSTQVTQDERSKKGEIVKETQSQPEEIVRKDKVESTNELYPPIIERDPMLISNKINEMIEKGQSLHYDTTDTGEHILKVVDGDGETVRQIPSEVALKVSRAIYDFMTRTEGE